MKYRTWKNGKPPKRRDYCTDLRACVCWRDLWRLGKWYVANLLDRLDRWCWADLALWAIQPDYERNSTSRRQCEKDSAECGSCWCGRVVDMAAMSRLYPVTTSGRGQ